MLAVGILGCSLGECAVWESAGETGPQPRIFMVSQLYSKNQCLVCIVLQCIYATCWQNAGQNVHAMFASYLTAKRWDDSLFPETALMVCSRDGVANEGTGP